MQKEPGPWSTEGGDVHFRTVMIFFFFFAMFLYFGQFGGPLSYFFENICTHKKNWQQICKSRLNIKLAPTNFLE